MLGSIKGQIGHTEVVAGLAGVLKVILALRREVRQADAAVQIRVGVAAHRQSDGVRRVGAARRALRVAAPLAAR